MNHRTPDQSDMHDDALDALLRQWHDTNADRAMAQRDQLMSAVSGSLAARRAAHANPFRFTNLRRIVMNRYTPIAASIALLATLLVLLVPMTAQPAFADGGVVMVPEGGRLEALDEKGNLIGPCALKHTHVDVRVSGFLSRVTLTQEYHNPYDNKIEAVYTFPMSHRGAVDGFKMIVGDRIVEGEVKEREAARQIYEAARDQGYVASLLEQERPNIFTQSVANIEPNATVKIEISYIEIIEEKDGEYEFSFPMVVGPRYIPGSPTVTHALVPAELTVRRGVILKGPARLTIAAAGDASTLGTLQPGKLEALLSSAHAIEYPGEMWWGKGDATGGAAQPTLWHRFEAVYGDGSKEFGELFADGTGWINGRWFYFDPEVIKDMGTGFEQNTNQVPDASRITPMPVPPGMRAGHDISLTMTIDTGGPRIVALDSPLHEITGDDVLNREGAHPSKLTIQLANAKEIPNRDFVLQWKQDAESITEATFTHTGKYGDYAGGFFTLILEPPARVNDWPVRPRELVFVMDTSGSMNGFPIEKSKEVISGAIAAMRPDDTFNIITFAGDTHILWSAPRPATEQNRAEAQAFVQSRQGGGGTEMMNAIHAALVQGEPVHRADSEKKPLTFDEVANLPADGRELFVVMPYDAWNTMGDEHPETALNVRDDLAVRIRREWKNVEGTIHCPVGEPMLVTGTWSTVEGQRIFIGKHAKWKPMPGADAALDPMRIVLFLTDGYVGNEAEIIQAVRDNASTTRVFSFGIGNSINRFLLDGMAEAGRGEVEYVLLSDNGEEAVQRFTKRIETPVLTDITLAFSDTLVVTDVLPKGGMVPDLFDAKPLVIQGRYAPGRENAKGTLTIRGNTGGGPYERTLDLTFPAYQPEHRATATLWARSMVDEYTKLAERDPTNVASIVALGESFQIMTAHTSFVAVEKSRVTIEGKPVLVAIPVELPAGTNWEGFFGGESNNAEIDGDTEIMLGAHMQFQEQTEHSNDGFSLGIGDVDVLERRAGAEQLGAIELGETLMYFGAEQNELGQAVQPTIGYIAQPAGEFGTTSRDQAGAPSASTLTPAIAGKQIQRVQLDISLAFDPSPNTSEELRERTLSAGRSNNAPAEAAPPPPPAASPVSRPDAPTGGAPAGTSAPDADGRQLGREQSKKDVTIDGAISGGGGGGFGGGAGGRGGSIFDDPGDALDDESSSSADESRLEDALVTDVTEADQNEAGEADLQRRVQLESLADQFNVALANPLPPQLLLHRSILLIAALETCGSLESARSVTNRLADPALGYEPGVTMHRILHDDTLTLEARHAQVLALETKAKAAIRELYDAARRAMRMRHVLDVRLLPMAGGSLPTALDTSWQGELPAGVVRADGGVLLTILLHTLDAPARKELESRGLMIKATSAQGPFVVAAVPPGRIAALALLENVRRIEPARTSAE